MAFRWIDIFQFQLQLMKISRPIGERAALNFRKFLVLLSVVLFSSTGDVMLSRGMKQVGEIHLTNLGSVFSALENFWVLLGICFLLIFFASYVTSLSWADLTFVLPATSFSYVMMALLARTLLHEHISVQRWCGIMLIVAGVGFVAGGPSHTERAAKVTQPAPELAKPKLMEAHK
jgi:drug/metabolite transporter (DMT)-like permease